MSSPKPEIDPTPQKPKSKKRILYILAGIPLLLAIGGGVVMFVPAVNEKAHGLFAHEAPPAETQPPKPVFVDLPEMSVTLPNGGQARQLRIRISVELMKAAPGTANAQVLSPKAYDALLIYLRTLTDAEIDNSLAIDRVRGDLYRRLTLILGKDVVQDVLITSFVVA